MTNENTEFDLIVIGAGINGALAAEVIFAFKAELARTLSDCLLRRTMVGMNSSCGLNANEAAGALALRHLGWSEKRVAPQVAAYRKEINGRFLVSADPRLNTH
jgi:glycerol-3-phosphate dehydrogenase